jgi:hypothetical protein
MSFLKIVDIVANAGRNRLGGPTSLAGNRKYDKDTHRFPIDVGSFDKGHYLLININTQKRTQFKSNLSGDDPTVIANLKDLQKRRGATNIGQTKTAVGGTAIAAGITQSVVQFGQAGASFASSTATQFGIPTSISGIAGSIGGSAVQQATQNTLGATGDFVGGFSKEILNSIGSLDGGFLRTIQRSTDTIAIYMPDTLSFSYAQGYSNPSLSSDMLMKGAAAASSVLDSPSEGGGNIANILTRTALGAFGETGRALFAAGAGLVQNPMIEVIYSSPALRKFQFSFMFYPRSEAEALQVQKIIEKLRFHQAPEIKSSSGGFFLVPPSEFDIKFMYNGYENPNIDKVSTCVLENINVNYVGGPGGFSAYEVQGENVPRLGKTGMPLAIAMSLSFMETQIITKEYYRGNSSEILSDLENYLNVFGG